MALLATVGFGVKKSMMSSDAGLSDLALANVEALANGEGGGGGVKIPCTYSPGSTCTFNCIVDGMLKSCSANDYKNI